MRLADLSMPLKRLPVICPSRAWSKPPVQLVVLIVPPERMESAVSREGVKAFASRIGQTGAGSCFFGGRKLPAGQRMPVYGPRGKCRRWKSVQRLQKGIPESCSSGTCSSPGYRLQAPSPAGGPDFPHRIRSLSGKASFRSRCHI